MKEEEDKERRRNGEETKRRKRKRMRKKRKRKSRRRKEEDVLEGAVYHMADLVSVQEPDPPPHLSPSSTPLSLPSTALSSSPLTAADLLLILSFFLMKNHPN